MSLLAFTCPHCGNGSYGREITRHVARSWLYRRRECEHCEGRYSTREMLVSRGGRHVEIGGDATAMLDRVRDVVGR